MSGSGPLGRSLRVPLRAAGAELRVGLSVQCYGGVATWGKGDFAGTPVLPLGARLVVL